MKTFVNTSGVPLETAKPRLDGRIVGGTPTTIQNHPWQVWPWFCCSVGRYFEVFEQNRPPVLVMTHLKFQNILQNRKTRLWLCAAAEVSLTDQTKTGDSQVLFVDSATQSQFHFTYAYYFELFTSKQTNKINFLQKEKPTIFKHISLLGRRNTWINDVGVIKIIM